MIKKNINLLIEKGAPPTVWEKFYDWVTNVARVIVIVTESVVLAAFGWRFYLDRKLNDLKDDISITGDTLSYLSTEEDSIRSLQSKINSYEELWLKSSQLNEIITEVNSYIPEEVDELSFSITTGTTGSVVNLSGKIDRELINNLENNMKDSSSFTNVTLSKIEKQSGGDLYDFSLSADIIFNQGRI